MPSPQREVAVFWDLPEGEHAAWVAAGCGDVSYAEYRARLAADVRSAQKNRQRVLMVTTTVAHMLADLQRLGLPNTAEGRDTALRLSYAPDGGKLAPCDSTDTLDKPCYDYKGLSRTSAVLDDMVGALRAVGIDVYQIDHEDANGQFEVNFTYADAMKSADVCPLKFSVTFSSPPGAETSTSTGRRKPSRLVLSVPRTRHSPEAVLRIV